MQIKKIKSNVTEIIMMFSIVALGGFFEFVSCIASIALLANIIVKVFNKKEIKIQKSILSISVAIICLFYGISIFWAIDKGMSFIGFLKFLPLILFVISMNQEEKTNIENVLPIFVAIVSVITMALMQIAAIKEYFSVSGRFAGCFQYPNSYALLLLISELIVFKKEKLTLVNYATVAVLVFSLLYTGSRIAFALFVLSNIAVLFFRNLKRIKIVAVSLTGFVLVICIFLLIFKNNPIIGRYLKISVFESTFVGRILYFVDAIPLMLKHPFGMGYLGYSYIQQSIQTGVYTVKYIHNDFLQLILDIGFVPAILFAVAIVRACLNKSKCVFDKIIICTIVLHSLLDFDLQFISIAFILIYFLNDNSQKLYSFKNIKSLNVVFVIFILLNAYMSSHLLFSYFKKYDSAKTLYKFNTDNNIYLLSQEKDLAQANEMADEIIRQNEELYIPYSIKSKYYFSKGDFKNVIDCKHNVFKKSPFEYGEYEEYIRMLIYGIQLYIKAGDNKSASICFNELEYAKEKLADNKNKLSSLGKMIDDQPKTDLPEELVKDINEIEKLLKK